jgi:biotin synthesis protein BioG
MDITWINREDNPKCILFFNGWGMDENAIKHLDYSGFDICMFSNYKTIEEAGDEFSGYNEVNVVAWSMGVWAASQILEKSNIKITKAIAINGTERPVDDVYGISKAVFRGTLEGWDERNRNKFNMRMLGGRDNYKNFSDSLSSRSLEDQKNELQSIFDNRENSGTLGIGWSKAIVGEKDMIFTPHNQKNWWDGKTGMVIKNIPHFPFIGLKSWESIL